MDTELETEWIESFNSFFDDNKILTLLNGECLKIGDKIKFIFECRDLDKVSPATISRLGLIYY